jgi:hypothetical protein
MWAASGACAPVRLLGAVFCLCACSAATDVVGVIDQKTTDVTATNASAGSDPAAPQAFAASGVSDGTTAELLVVAGLPLRDWQGPTFGWPLGVRLRAFFSDSSWPGRSGPPDHVEREAFARMGAYSEQRHDDVRFVPSTGDIADTLRQLFVEATVVFGDEPRSIVTRDGWGDEYMVVLGTTTCERASSSHHGETCADLTDNSGASGFDTP